MPRRRQFHPSEHSELVVDRPDLLAECLDHLRSMSTIGLDTEFVGEDSYRPELCLVQVSTPSRLYLIDPYSSGPLDQFWELLLDPQRTVVVHAGREELRMCRHAIGQPPASVFDVQIAAALVGFNYPIGYGNLVQELLGVRAHKRETLTDWRRRPLSPAQRKYAFDDVRFLLPIWERLSEALHRHGRTTWADEEFTGFVRWAVTDDPDVEKWRKIKGLGGMSRRELSIVRAVYQWREAVADRTNRPPRFILRDDLIVEIARRAPSRAEDLQALRGLPQREIDSILAAVRPALELPTESMPLAVEREFDPPHIATLSTLLGVVLAEWCARMRLAPNVVATSQDLKALVRARQPDGPEPTGSSLTTGWRAEVVRPYLESILDGTAAIRVTDPASATPIAVHPLDSEKPTSLPEPRGEAASDSGERI